MSLTLNFKQKIQANKTTADLNNKKSETKIKLSTKMYFSFNK